MACSLAGHWLRVADGWSYEVLAKAPTGRIIARSSVHFPVTELKELIPAHEVERIQQQALDLCMCAAKLAPVRYSEN
jgi:hypothetical protein